jgi:uncharacterized protein (DUF885 family)
MKGPTGDPCAGTGFTFTRGYVRSERSGDLARSQTGNSQLRDSAGLAPGFADASEPAVADEPTLPGGGLARRAAPCLAAPMDDLTRLADDYWVYRLRTEGVARLWRGDNAYLDLMEDVSLEGVADRRERLAGFAAEAEHLQEGPGRALAATIRFTGLAAVIEQEWRHDIGWPNHAVGLHALVAAFLPRFVLTEPDHADAFVAKVRNTGLMFDQLSDRLRHNAGAGRTPIRLAVTRTIDALERYLATDPANDPLTRVAPPPGLDPIRAESFRRAVIESVRDGLHPAFERYHAVLVESVLPAARSDDQPGICHLDGGEDGYARLVWAHTSTRLTPSEIHEIGLDQIGRLAAEYRALAGPLLGTDRLEEIFERLRSDPALHYREAGSLVADAERALRRAEEAAPAAFDRLPSAPCTAEATSVGALAYYSSPAEDGSRPGTFFFNTADPGAWGTFQIEATTFHEGVPGHHLQLALAQETPGLHPVHAKLYLAAFNEGWALYTERLADELGLYSSDLARLGMLTGDSMRACRLVVDTGMHAFAWTRTQAIDFMVANSPMTRVQSEGEIDRYLAMPGQALGYMIGRLEIDRIRREAEQRLSSGFRLAGFHNTVLANGTVPLDVLGESVDGWVDRLSGSRA